MSWNWRNGKGGNGGNKTARIGQQRRGFSVKFSREGLSCDFAFWGRI